MWLLKFFFTGDEKNRQYQSLMLIMLLLISLAGSVNAAGQAGEQEQLYTVLNPTGYPHRTQDHGRAAALAERQDHLPRRCDL